MQAERSKERNKEKRHRRTRNSLIPTGLPVGFLATDIMTKKEIVETIKKMNNEKVINLWNKCVEEKSYPHNTIYTNNCAVFNSFFTPYDAVMSVLYGHYDENDDYVIIDEHDTCQSFTNWNDTKSPVDMNILVNWLFEKEN